MPPDKKLWEESGGLLIRGSEVRVLPGASKSLQIDRFRRTLDVLTTATSAYDGFFIPKSRRFLI